MPLLVFQGTLASQIDGRRHTKCESEVSLIPLAKNLFAEVTIGVAGEPFLLPPKQVLGAIPGFCRWVTKFSLLLPPNPVFYRKSCFQGPKPLRGAQNFASDDRAGQLIYDITPSSACNLRAQHATSRKT